MGQFWDELPDHILTSIAKQKLFFVATAPLQGKHVNCSPKGYDTFSVISPKQLAYIDFMGSGVETISHVKENGRIVFMWANFDEGAPWIVRAWGTGRAVEAGTAEFDALMHRAFTSRGLGSGAQEGGVGRAVRGIVVCDVFKCSRSCGYAVPLMRFEGERQTYREKVSCMSDEKLASIRAGNARSLDGLPGWGAPAQRRSGAGAAWAAAALVAALAWVAGVMMAQRALLPHAMAAWVAAL